MRAQRIFSYFVFFLSLVLIPGGVFGGAISDTEQALESPADPVSIPVMLVPASLPPSAEGENASEVVHTPRADKVALAGVIRVVGVVGRDNKWQVVLKEYSTGETRFLREGETAFGYRVKRITRRGVMLERAGKEFALRVGEYSATVSSVPSHDLPPVHDAPLNSSIPELLNMGSIERQLWVAQWMDAVSALGAEEQEPARAQMRDYWRQQWEGPWGNVIRRMMPEEQESIRREISGYWRR